MVEDSLRERRHQKELELTTTDLEEPVAAEPQGLFKRLGEGGIQEYFEMGAQIYSAGEKGKVLVGRRRGDGLEVVVKVRAKHCSPKANAAWQNMMALCHDLDKSPHVLRISEIYEGRHEFYVVMPKCNGGELFEFLATADEIPESECQRIMREILTAVSHLHSSNIVHRDIKPENIMFDLDQAVPSSPKAVKLIDFDTCVEWSPKASRSCFYVGTPGYIAPESLLGEYSPRSDMWSVGVVFYTLMTGRMPFDSGCFLEGLVGSNRSLEEYRAMKLQEVDWSGAPWPDFPMARDLCQQMLRFDSRMRLSADEALAHPWLFESR